MIEIFKINHKIIHTYILQFLLIQNPNYKIEYPLYEKLWAPNASGFHFLFPNLKHLCRHEILREQSQVYNKPIHAPIYHHVHS